MYPKFLTVGVLVGHGSVKFSFDHLARILANEDPVLYHVSVPFPTAYPSKSLLPDQDASSPGFG